MDKTYKYMVAINCFTYNHNEFIVSAMDGFVQQKTSFPFVAIIIDDASTDGTDNTITNYINQNFIQNSPSFKTYDENFGKVICANHKENSNCTFVVVLLNENHFGRKAKKTYVDKWLFDAKYFAMCEGDDYWICDNKLQSQVDFLEKHNDYAITCHRYKVYDFENDIWMTDKHDDIFYNHPKGLSFDYEHNINWLTKTLSLVFKPGEFLYYDDYPLDKEMVYVVMKQGLGFCFNEEWGVYRVSQKGICGKQSLLNNRMRAYETFKRMYEKDPTLLIRKEYYSLYSTILFLSKGKILTREKFEIKKFISALFLAVEKYFRYLKRKGKGGYRLSAVE